MQLPCFNHGNASWFSVHRWAYLDGGEAAPDYNRVAYVSGSGEDDASARAARLERRREAVAADAAAAAAAAGAKEGDKLATLATPAQPGEAVDESGRSAREHLRQHEVDPKLEAGIQKYMRKVRAALDQEKLKDNFAKLEKFAAFIKNHQTFEKGQGKQWNHDFCKDILGLDNISAQEEHYAAFAYQRFMDRWLEEFGGYRLHEKGITNSFTRMDGWIGAYGVNVLMFYVHEDCRGNTNQTVWNKWWNDRRAWDWVELGDSFNEDQKNDFKRTSHRLMEIYEMQEQTGSTTQRTDTQGGGTDVARGAARDADVSGERELNENFNTYLGHYSHLMHQRYPDLGLFPPRQTREQFLPLFNRIADYLDAKDDQGNYLHEEDPSTLTLGGWLHVFGKAGLNEEEQGVLYSPPASHRFEAPDLNEESIRDFYKSYHWTNYAGLQKKGGEVDSAWFTVSDFLGDPAYSGREVQKAYEAYNVIKDDSSVSQKDIDTAFDALGRAIEKQQKQAEARLREWKKPGRLPKEVAALGDDRSITDWKKEKLAIKLPGAFRNQIGSSTPAHEALKPIFKILKNYDQDVAFADYPTLKAAAYPDLLKKFETELQRNEFLEPLPAEETERERTVERNNNVLWEVFNNAIWIRNIEQFLSERQKRFLPPEK